MRRDEILARLLEAAEALLATGESFTEVSVERLVAEAGISRSTFYVYFEDKGALLRAMSEDIMQQEIEATQQWLDLPADATREELGAALRHIIDVYRPHQALMAAVVDVSSYDASVRDQFGMLIDTAIGAIAEHIRAGQAEASVHAELDPAAVASWLTWMAERGCYQIIRGADDAAVDRFADALTNIVWNTLYARIRS